MPDDLSVCDFEQNQDKHYIWSKKELPRRVNLRDVGFYTLVFQCRTYVCVCFAKLNVSTSFHKLLACFYFIACKTSNYAF